ncbi:hypothetical protein [Lactobacillus melliventris]|uniref:hypothetical protein n=1 Tax=Lactobacillus melliventris TaxID=1218507 RepID=UPI00164FCF8C|nr:hypothetical protein [Lactobacillus melliventris]MBC6349587.1 hypothetical protein [Lactobacillus melliventris]
MKIIQRLTTILAIILWLVVIGIFAVAISNNQLWSMGPVIAYNRPQNALGWLIVAAIAATAVSVILKLTRDK